MMRAFPLALALTAALAASAQAQTTEPRDFTKGTPVTIVGMVSSQPRDIGVTHEQKMQVAVGPARTDYTLHMGKAKVYNFHGREMSIDDFRDKMWVRAEGMVMDDPRRIEVTRVQVIGANTPDVRRTVAHRPGFDYGYVMTTGAPARPNEFAEGTPVSIVGEISSAPKGAVNEQKMQVAVGPARTDYTLHFGDATIIGPFGQKLDEDGLDDGQWVRAEGRVMDDPRRIKVSRVQVIARDRAGLPQSAFYRSGFEQGYVSAVAGSRETFPGARMTFAGSPFTIIGRVSDDTGSLETTRKIQVQSAGNEWTLNVNDDALVVDDKGEKISVHELDEGQWIRATGWQTDDLRMRIARVENLGAEEAFRRTRYFRTEAPLGYVERVAGERAQFVPLRYSGTVVSIHEPMGYFVVRDSKGQMRHVYPDSSEFTVAGGRSGVFAITDLRVGDRVTVSGRSLQFR